MSDATILAMGSGTARQRVLAYLRKQPAATISQIAQGLELSAATVAHHLRVLKSDGRVAMAGKRHATGRGRPRTVYRVSDLMLGNNLAMLANSLLDMQMVRPASVRNAVVDRLVAGLGSQIGATDPRQSVVRRLGVVVERLNAVHYQASWEAGAQGPRILFAHCPYADIIETHPELCKMDALALGQSLNLSAEQLAKIDPAGRTATHCVFSLK
jgi:predicted ArsR family transcriptional regulator